jgi:endonuclease YncB( thermonuclease family)
MKKTITAALVAALFWPGAASAAAPIDYVVDGDTIRLDNGVYVRLIGIDTPEVGQCGYDAAKRTLDRLLGDETAMLNPITVDDTDRYGRLLRYVDTPDGRDAGKILLKRGLATARYDSRDGYDWHPREARYHRVDAANPDRC